MPKTKKFQDFAGTWRIYEMELWDKEYLDMEVKAFIRIIENGEGAFQFGLVSANIDGKIVDYPNGKKLEFTFNGMDECDPINGSGWLRLRIKNIIEGEFRFHMGDSSGFLAERTKK
jgi:hypothetical protein